MRRWLAGFPDARAFLADVRSRTKLCAAAARAGRFQGAPAPAALRRLSPLAGAARSEPRVPRAVGAGVEKRHAEPGRVSQARAPDRARLARRSRLWLPYFPERRSGA